jgi:hypothetical protein
MNDEFFKNKDFVKDCILKIRKQKGKCYLCGGKLFLGGGYVKMGAMFTHEGKFPIPHIAHAGCCRGIMYYDYPELYHKKYRKELFNLIEETEKTNKRGRCC